MPDESVNSADRGSSTDEAREEAAKPDAPSAPGAPADTGELDLSEGKTLSDYIVEEPEPPPAPPEPARYASIPNVESLVVPPPGGVLNARRREREDERPAESAQKPRPPTPEAPSRPPVAASPARVPEAPPAGTDSDHEDFETMLERSLGTRAFESGETVRGRIVAIGPDVAFLDIGGKSEASIDIEELKDPEGNLDAELGDQIEAIVVSTEGGLRLSRRLARGAAAKGQLSAAFAARVPVEGRVERAIKGGYEVRIAGMRAFCPISQIDTVRTVDPAVHEGRVYEFRIIELRDGGKKLVVSRRALLQEEQDRRAEETRRALVPGAVLRGRVVSVREYGAFVDLGGVQGLVHVSEMGWARVSSAGEIVKPGDEVTVKVLRIDEQKGKISLGMKQLQDDPWTRALERYAVGQVVQGRIVRLQDFGAFVELEPGVEGLAHVSTFPPTGTPDGWKGAAPAGTSGEFEILSVDPERKRIGIAMILAGSSRSAVGRGEEAAASPEQAPGGAAGSAQGAEGASARRETAGPRAASGPRPGPAPIAAGTRIKGKVERHEKFGVFVFLAPGRTGLMPFAETAAPRGADLRKLFPVGGEIEVLVLDVDPSGRRIRVSRKALLDFEERVDTRAFAARGASPAGFGSFGDKLRAALAPKQK